MGQFYKAPQATFIDDAMFKLPYELMAKIAEKKNKDIGDFIDATVKLGDDQKIDYDPRTDAENAKKIRAEIDAKTQGFVDKILEDAINYQKVQPQITSFGRDLLRRTQTGDIGALAQRKALIKDYEDTQSEIAKKDPEKYSHWKGHLALQLSELRDAPLQNEDGSFRLFSGIDLLGADSMPKIVDAALAHKLGKTFDKMTDIEKGDLRTKIATQTEGWTSEDLKKSLIDFIEADPTIVRAFRQAENVGTRNLEQELIQGVDYMINTYGKVTTKDERTETLTDAGKRHQQEKEDKDARIIYTDESQYASDLNATQSYDQMYAVLNGKIEAPQDTRGRWANTYEQSMRSKNMSDEAIEKNLKAFEKLTPAQQVALTFTGPETQRAQLENYKSLVTDSKIAQGRKQALEQKQKDGTSFIDAKPLPGQISNSTSSWKNVDMSNAQIEKFQEDLVANRGNLHVRAQDLNGKLKKGGSPFYSRFVAKNSSDQQGKILYNSKGTHVITYNAADGKTYVRPVILTPANVEAIRQGKKINLTVGNKTINIKPVRVEYIERIQTGDVSVQYLQDKKYDIIIRKGTRKETSTEGGTPTTDYTNERVNEGQMTFETNTVAPSSQFTEGQPFYTAIGKAGDGQTIQFRLPKNLNATTGKLDEYFNSIASDAKQEDTLNMHGISVSPSGKVSNFTISQETPVKVQGKTKNLRIDSSGRVWVDGRNVTDRKEALSLIKAFVETP